MVRQMSVHEICALSFRTFHSEKYADDYNKGQEKKKTAAKGENAGKVKTADSKRN